MIIIVITPPKTRTSGSLMRILLLIILYVLRMYLSMLGPYTCLYQSRKWHVCIYRTMKGLSSLPFLLRDNSPIVFGRGRAQALTSRESYDNLELPSFFHYAWSGHYMMKIMGYYLTGGDGLNFSKRRCIPMQSFVPEGKPPDYYDHTSKGLGYITPRPQSEPESKGSLPSQSSDSSRWDSDCSVRVVLKKLFTNMTSISRTEQVKTLSHSTLICGLNNWIFDRRSVSTAQISDWR